MLIAPKWLKLRISNLVSMSRQLNFPGNIHGKFEVQQSHNYAFKLLLGKNLLRGDRHSHGRLLVITANEYTLL